MANDSELKMKMPDNPACPAAQIPEEEIAAFTKRTFSMFRGELQIVEPEDLIETYKYLPDGACESEAPRTKQSKPGQDFSRKQPYTLP